MKKPKLAFILLIVIGIILPFLTYADLVPCGGRDENGNPEPECTFCDIFRMLQGIINYIWWALLVIAPIFIIAGGIMILTAGVKPDQVDHGKRIITGTVTGLAIAFLSWSILNVIFIQFAGDPGSAGFPWPWNEIRCTGGAVGNNTWNQVVNRYCHVQLRMAPDQMVQDYVTGPACSSGCPSQCTSRGGSCEGWCCLSSNQQGLDPVCNAQVISDRCDTMSQPVSYTFNYNGNAGNYSTRYNLARGVNDQVRMTVIELQTLLACIGNYTDFPTGTNLTISSITDNSGGRCVTNWTNPACNTLSPIPDSCTGTCCAHSQNSLHYGGANCRGNSYAVDITNVNLYDQIRLAALWCAGLEELHLGTITVLNETSHVHIQLTGEAQRDNCSGTN